MNHHPTDEGAQRQVRVLLAVCTQRALAQLVRRRQRALRVEELRQRKQRERGQSDG